MNRVLKENATKLLDQADRMFGYPELPEELREASETIEQLILKAMTRCGNADRMEVFVPPSVWGPLVAYLERWNRWDEIFNFSSPVRDLHRVPIFRSAWGHDLPMRKGYGYLVRKQPIT